MTANPQVISSQHPFDELKPDFILDAIESQGFSCDGRILALNSYENRVYQIGIDDQQPLIAKFYRPDRWNRDQIMEEHEFIQQLVEHELPVVPPIANTNGETLHTHRNFQFGLFPRKGGYAPELSNMDHLVVIGRCLGRIHKVSSSRPFQYRPALDSHTFGHESIDFIGNYFIPHPLAEAYNTLSRDLMNTIDETLKHAFPARRIRAHGDCHPGNMLWRDDAPHFIDFDDSRMAPAIQDIWMLLSGDTQQQRMQLSRILEGYEQFHSFDTNELMLIEVFRTLRIIYFSAWIARRWNDPAFPHGFPWFNTVRYWEEHILILREQLAALQEPALSI